MDLFKEFIESEQPLSTSTSPPVNDYRDVPSIAHDLGNGTTIPTHPSSYKTGQEPEINMDPDPNLSPVANLSTMWDDLTLQVSPSTVLV